METYVNMIPYILSIITGVVASSGFWAFLQWRMEKNDVRTELLIGIAHDRIIYLGEKYINRGYITTEEFNNLHDHLYIPYKKNGGNGGAERIMKIVMTLPTKKVKENDHGTKR